MLVNMGRKFKLIFLVSLLTQLFFAKDVESAITAPQEDAFKGKRYVVLKHDEPFAAQITSTNTVYEIRYDFDLEARSIIIPKDCVLYFIGGSINNGVIVGRNTNIFFVSGELCCQLNGSFNNENIHLEWFGIKSGKANLSNNDKIMQSYVIPSMESIGNTLYMSPQTSMYFSNPIIFNGSYDLDLRGCLRYSGAIESIAVSIGTPGTKINGKEFRIKSVISDTKDVFKNGKVKENVGICLWNLKLCNITIDEVLNFGYCLRLCGNIGGCSSNNIHFTRLGGNCYYGIHCYSYDSGWVNENTFYCKSIINYSANPAKDIMCAIWLDARGTNTCNSNLFFAPNVENCHYIAKYSNAIFNIIYDARAEKIGQALSVEGKSKNNSLYCKYWGKDGDFSSYGSNRVVKISEIIPPLTQICSEQIGVTDTQHYGVCFGTGGFRIQGKVNGNMIYGKIVEIADTNKDVNIELVFEQPGRFGVFFLNNDYTCKKIDKLDDYILNADISLSPINGGVRGNSKTRRASVRLSKKCGKLLIGTYGGDALLMNIYSDNLIVDELYSSNNDTFVLEKNACVTPFYYEDGSRHFLSSIGTIKINSAFDLNMNTMNLVDKEIIIGRNGHIINGTIDVTGSFIYPNFNALIDESNVVITGMPATGTMFFQNGKPTWSNGREWVDANGQIITINQ